MVNELFTRRPILSFICTLFVFHFIYYFFYFILLCIVQQTIHFRNIIGGKGS